MRPVAGGANSVCQMDSGVRGHRELNPKTPCWAVLASNGPWFVSFAKGQLFQLVFNTLHQTHSACIVHGTARDILMTYWIANRISNGPVLPLMHVTVPASRQLTRPFLKPLDVSTAWQLPLEFIWFSTAPGRGGGGGGAGRCDGFLSAAVATAASLVQINPLEASAHADIYKKGSGHKRDTLNTSPNNIGKLAVDCSAKFAGGTAPAN